MQSHEFSDAADNMRISMTFSGALEENLKFQESQEQCKT